MPKWGVLSAAELAGVHPDLQCIFNEVIKHRDCKVLQHGGFRTKETQDLLYEQGRSKLRWPKSKHNEYPSDAIDVAPWFSLEPHIRWDDKEAFYEFAGFVQGIAAARGIPLRWGGNWDLDDELHDQNFFDLVHFELILEED